MIPLITFCLKTLIWQDNEMSSCGFKYTTWQLLHRELFFWVFHKANPCIF